MDAVFDGLEAVVELGELGDDAGDGVVFSGSAEEFVFVEVFFGLGPTCGFRIGENVFHLLKLEEVHCAL